MVRSVKALRMVNVTKIYGQECKSPKDGKCNKTSMGRSVKALRMASETRIYGQESKSPKDGNCNEHLWAGV